ncbi:MAG: hypothetical protein KDK89_18400 [Alphaproteobacteria bacterium]|nr:hypothetical protein [Alphaproteobacteria bacterium]
MAMTKAQPIDGTAIYKGINGNNARNEGVAVLSPKQRETAQYIADMILELRNMAKSNRLHATMVPLEYAYYEAYSAANQVHVPQDEIARVNKLAQTVQELESSDLSDR